MLNNLGLGLAFVGKDELSPVAAKVEGSLNRVRGTAKVTSGALNRSFAFVGATASGLALAGVGLAKYAGEFEYEVQRVANISGATAGELKGLRDAAIEAGLVTKFSPTEAIQALGALASRGFEAKESMDLLGQSLSFAAGGSIGIEKSAATVASAIRVFSIAGDEVDTVSDKLLKITNLTSLTAGDLERGLGTISRGAGLTKQNFDEMLISMGLVRNAGVQTTVAASSVSAALVFAAQKADKFRDKLGISVTDSSGKFKNFMDLVAEFDQVVSEKYTNAAERAKITTELFGRFGTTAVQNVSEQLKAMAARRPDIDGVTGAIAYLRGELEGAAGTAKEFADRLNNTFKGQVTILKGALQTLAVVVGEPIGKLLTPVVKGLAQAVSAVARWFNDLHPIAKKVIGGLIIGVSVVAALGAAFIAVKMAMVVAGPAIAAIGAALAGIVASAGPVLLVIGGVGAAIAGLALGIKTNFGGIGDFFRDLYGTVSLFFRAMIQLVRQGGFSGAVMEELGRAENAGIKTFAIRLYQLGYRVVRFFQGVVDSIQRYLGPPVKRLVTAFGGLFSAIQRGAGAVLGILGAIGRMLGLVSTKGAEVVTNVPSQSFWETGARFAEVFAKSLGVVVNVLSRITEGIAWLANGIAWVIEKVVWGLNFIQPHVTTVMDAIVTVASAALEIILGILGKVAGAVGEIITWAEKAVDLAKEVGAIAKKPVDWLFADATPEELEFRRQQRVERVRALPEFLQPVAARQMGLSEEDLAPPAPSGGGQGETQGLVSMFQEMSKSIAAIAATGERPMVVQVMTPNNEVIFEAHTRGAAESQSRSFDVAPMPR